MPAARRLVLAATLNDGRILLVGGLAASTTNAVDYSASVYIYNPSTNEYSTKNNAPIRMSGGRSVVLTDGRVVLFPNTVSDGTTVTTSNKRTWLYTPATDTFVEADPVPAEVAFGGMVGQLSDGTAVYDLAPGEYRIVCKVPGHSSMNSTLTVD